MKKLVIYTENAEETRVAGAKLAAAAEPNMVFLMKGDLGAGKTTMTQGMARGLGIARHVTSPTFNLLKIYKGRMPLYHIDAYRLEGVSQDLGFEEFLNDDGLTVIEWSQFVPDLIPEEHLSISLHLETEDRRRIELEASGEAYEKLLEVFA